MAATERKLLTVSEVSEWLGVPIQTLYGWNHRGVGPRPFKVGRHLRYEADDVQAWLADQRSSVSPA